MSSRHSAVGAVWSVPWLAMIAASCHPDIPHPVSSTSDESCVRCHAGRAGAPSSGHNDRSGCTSCHDVTVLGEYPALMPHRGGDEASCLLCHKDGTDGAVVTSHVGETDCYTCHEAPDYGPWPPSVSHMVTSPADASCLACHGDIDHQEQPSCLACHKS